MSSKGTYNWMGFFILCILNLNLILKKVLVFSLLSYGNFQCERYNCFAHENINKMASKISYINLIAEIFSTANQPKSQIMFHKNGSPRHLYIMTLTERLLYTLHSPWENWTFFWKLHLFQDSFSNVVESLEMCFVFIN